MHFNIKLKMLEYMIKKSHTPTFIIEPKFSVLDSYFVAKNKEALHMKEKYVTITGTNHYYGTKPFSVGKKVKCFKEPDNCL